ncbi:hypothetical protein JRQ81_001905 [Phrynocephalus forsythii]|uniref:Uncharacterized protein n=1 Tax=Phrynocephalus forsythii TaxID=171643 RepID=A0A9Q0Y857_9SAUR|nr:hypothetical protein JRQ81_001905 [Phrynocephalus forsythii]
MAIKKVHHHFMLDRWSPLAQAINSGHHGADGITPSYKPNPTPILKLIKQARVKALTLQSLLSLAWQKAAKQFGLVSTGQYTTIEEWRNDANLFLHYEELDQRGLLAQVKFGPTSTGTGDETATEGKCGSSEGMEEANRAS